MALVEQLPHARRQILDCYRHRQIDSRQAVTLLGLSRRQFWRLLAVYRERGKKALTHGNRGRRGHRTGPRPLPGRQTTPCTFFITPNAG